jgi:hypothetical protein
MKLVASRVASLSGFFNPEDGDDMSLWNMSWLSVENAALFPITRTLHNYQCENLKSYIILITYYLTWGLCMEWSCRQCAWQPLQCDEHAKGPGWCFCTFTDRPIHLLCRTCVFSCGQGLLCTSVYIKWSMTVDLIAVRTVKSMWGKHTVLYLIWQMMQDVMQFACHCWFQIYIQRIS